MGVLSKPVVALGGGSAEEVILQKLSTYADFLFFAASQVPTAQSTMATSSMDFWYEEIGETTEQKSSSSTTSASSTSGNISSQDILHAGMVLTLNIGLASRASGLAAVGTLLAGGASMPLLTSCVPIVAPFNTPPVPLESWIGNKRACAFQRSLMFLSCAQGLMALAKFFGGNLIGGFFDCMIAGVGIYACSPEGVTMLSTYMVFAGFNGVMDFMQVLQMYHGVLPIYLLPFQYPAFRPLLLFLGCYFTWEFHKELTAVWRGYNCAGPQDTLFVKLMSHDWWGQQPGTNEFQQQGDGSNINTTQSISQRFTNWGSGTVGTAQDAPAQQPMQQPVGQRFAPFGGEGRRLGEE